MLSWPARAQLYCRTPLSPMTWREVRPVSIRSFASSSRPDTTLQDMPCLRSTASTEFVGALRALQPTALPLTRNLERFKENGVVGILVNNSATA